MPAQSVPTAELLDLAASIKAVSDQRRALALERDDYATEYVATMKELHKSGNLSGLLDAIRGFEIVYGPGWTKLTKAADLPDKKSIESALLGECNDGDGMWRGTFPLAPNDLRPPRGTWVVYRLLRGDELLYIGSTGAFLDRIKAHARDKDFDTWQAARCPSEKHCRHLEALLIDNYRPPLNRMIPRPKPAFA